MLNLRSKIAIKVLGYFFVNPNSSHYINELAGVLSLDVGNLFRKLKELEDIGILVSEKRGNQKYFSLNKNYSLLNETQKAFNAKYGIARLLKEKLQKIKGIEEAYIFGSYANDKMDQGSDIDVLLVGSHSTIEAKRMVLPLQKEVGREINIVDITPKELETCKQEGDDFIKNIFSHKIIKVI